MNNKYPKLRVLIIEDDLQEKIYEGILGPKQLGQTIKKIKQKYS